MGLCFIDWATAVVGEGDTCQLSDSFNYHSSGPIYETLAQSTEFDGILFVPKNVPIVVRAVNWVMGHPVTLDRVGVFLMNGNVAPFLLQVRFWNCL